MCARLSRCVTMFEENQSAIIIIRVRCCPFYSGTDEGLEAGIRQGSGIGAVACCSCVCGASGREPTTMASEGESFFTLEEIMQHTAKPASGAAVSSQRTTMVGEYVLGSLLGKGAYGRVYKAVSTTSGRFAAVKEMPIYRSDSGADITRDGSISASDIARIMARLRIITRQSRNISLRAAKYLASRAYNIHTKSNRIPTTSTHLTRIHNGTYESLDSPSLERDQDTRDTRSSEYHSMLRLRRERQLRLSHPRVRRCWLRLGAPQEVRLLISILFYGYLSRSIVIYRYLSLSIEIYHYISLSLVIYRDLSLSIVISRSIVIYRYLSLSI